MAAKIGPVLGRVFSSGNLHLGEYKRLNFLEKNKLYIEPVTVHFQPKSTEKKSKETTTVVMGQMISLNLVLQTFFQLPNVFDDTFSYYSELLEYRKTISNIVQTPMWKKVIDCLPPEYRSKLNNIFLLQVYRASDLHDCSRDEIFEKLILIFKQLYSEGITVILKDNRQLRIPFQVFFIQGNNLGPNGILGFNESFSSNFFCRFCKVQKSETKTLCVQVNEKLRNEKNYKRDLKLNESSQAGIKEDCIFNKFENFHVTKNKTGDLMHDMLEGICRTEMTNIVLNFLKGPKKYFSLKTLNHRLLFYKFNDSENRPPVVTETDVVNKRLKMTASQMMSFVLNFGLIVGDLITNKEDLFCQL